MTEPDAQLNIDTLQLSLQMITNNFYQSFECNLFNPLKSQVMHIGSLGSENSVDIAQLTKRVTALEKMYVLSSTETLRRQRYAEQALVLDSPHSDKELDCLIRSICSDANILLNFILNV